MRLARRRGVAFVAIGAALGYPVLASAPPAVAQEAPVGRAVLIFTMERAGLVDLLATPGFLALAQRGGAGLLSMTRPGDATYDGRYVTGRIAGPIFLWTSEDLGSMAGSGGKPSAAKLRRAADRVAGAIDGSSAGDLLVFVVSASPPVADLDLGDRLGAVVMARGAPADLVAAMRAPTPAPTPPHTLTSDSTRRDGVVTSRDLATTAIGFARAGDVRDPGGAVIRLVATPPPVDLDARYLQYRRLTVPIGTAAALYVTVAGLLGLLALGWRRSPRWLRALTAWLAISAPVLAIGLLLVGHLPSLTYATVVGFLVAVTALGTLALVPVARRRGSLAAVAAAGTGLLVALAVEAALEWTAALTPMLGGSELDGGRFFGLPNAFIGLVLGGSVYVAQRLPRAWGTAVIALGGLFAGSPWTGSNLGGAITLFAAAGLWWGLRGRMTWSRTLGWTAIAVVAGAGLVVVANRYLTSAPTHITRFVEESGGLQGAWHRFVDRLGVGVDLVRANPFALVPVMGVLATLTLIFRPTPPLRITFVEAPGWRVALLTIAVASLVAYVANDSGAAALGQGFTTSFGGLLYVSLLRRNGIMGEA